MSTVNEKMTAIADPIRSLTKEKQPLSLDDMANHTEQLVEANADLEKVLYGTDFGGKSQYDEFWDCLLNSGKRTDLEKVFRGADFSKTLRGFDPPYTIKPRYAGSMFAESSGITRITKGQIDFSNCASGSYCFYKCSDLIEIEEIHLPNNNTYMFSDSLVLEKIGKLIIPESTTTISSPFFNDKKLTHIAIEGKIPQTISFQWCSLLTHDSLTSIINALLNIKDTGTTATLTLHADAKAKLSDSDRATITQKGWTLA